MSLFRWPAFLLCVSIIIGEFPLQPQAEQTFFGFFPIPDETRSPIAIDTSNVTNRFDLTPLSIELDNTDSVRVTNTGKSIKATDETPNSKCRLSGGVVHDNRTYQLKEIEFIWTDKENGTSGTTIDGKGYVLEAEMRFFNKEYQTFNNSLNHRDGIVSLLYLLSTNCSSANNQFPRFGKTVAKITTAGTSRKSSLGISSSWFSNVSANTTYFAYAGAYKDEATGKLYYCKTIIVFPSYQCISYQQFSDSFKLVEDESGNRSGHTQKLQPARVKILQAKGVALTDIV